MDGEKTFRALRELQDDVPILFMSGHGEARGEEVLRGRRRVVFLAKPFTEESLLDALRRAGDVVA